MAPSFTTLILILLFNSRLTKGMKWKKYDGPQDANPDKALLEAIFGPMVTLHMWADPESSVLKSSSSAATLLHITFSIMDPQGTAYACAGRRRSKTIGPSLGQILSVTQFYQAVSADKDEEATLKRVQTDYESKGPKYFWIPADGTLLTNCLVAVMRAKYKIQVMLQQPCRGSAGLNAAVSSLHTDKHGQNSFNFEVNFGRTTVGKSGEETLVNYFGRWTESQLENDRSVSAYFSDPAREFKDATVRALLNRQRKKFMESPDGGALKLYKVWRVAVDRNGDIPVVAICAVVNGTDQFGLDIVRCYSVVEIRIYRGYDTVHGSEAFEAVANLPTDDAGANEKAAQLLSYPDSIAKGHLGELDPSATTTTRQIEGVVQ